MTKTFDYRLYPTKAQRTELSRQLEVCRWVYNKTLEVRKTAWETDETKVSRFDTHKLLPQWKHEIPVFKTVHSQVLQNVQKRVDLAFQAFFRRCIAGQKPGYPRFKGKNRYHSLTFPQYPGGAVLDGRVLRIRTVGSIRVNLHRPVEGKIKTTTIKRTSTGKWFVQFAVVVEPKPLPASSETVGIDVGLESLMTDDRGSKTANPRFFRKEEKALAQVQRRLAKQPRGSRARRFHRKAVARVHERIVHKRKDLAHKISRQLVDRYGVIVFEAINLTGMVKLRNLAKSIQDAAWSQIRTYTAYKAEEAGRTVVLVNPAYTSQDCSRCGHREKKSLSQRTHRCAKCGLVLDRDHNAAINILRLGLQSLGSERPRSPGLQSGE